MSEIKLYFTESTKIIVSGDLTKHVSFEKEQETSPTLLTPVYFGFWNAGGKDLEGND